MSSYFKHYEKYYNSLINNEQMVPNSANLSETYTNLQNNINNFFSNIKTSLWKETGKVTISNQIFTGISNSLNKLNILISTNLVNACNLAINSLLPKIRLIKTKEDDLNNLNNSLISFENDFNFLKNNMPQYKIINTATNEEFINPEYNNWENNISNLIPKISSLQTQIKKLITDIERLCQESNEVIEKILRLDNMSTDQIKAILPNYESYPINFISINDFNLEQMIINNSVITIDQIIADSKNNPPLFPFIINEKSIVTTKEGGIRFSFTYKNNGVTEEGIVLLPPNTTRNNKNIFAFYSGSGGLYIKNLNTTFNDTNPPYPMIAFGRNENNGGMVNEKIQSVTQIEATTSAINAFKDYLGNDNSKIHAIGHSMGAIELNQIVADKPNYFETASFINGRIRFDHDENRLNSYQNTTTKLNAFIATEDENVTLKEQIRSYNELVDINIDCYHIPIDPKNKKVGFGNNKIGLYKTVLFDQIENGLPTSLTEKHSVLIDKTTDNSASMDMFFIEGASHTGFLPSCLPNQDFYNLILNNRS